MRRFLSKPTTTVFSRASLSARFRSTSVPPEGSTPPTPTQTSEIDRIVAALESDSQMMQSVLRKMNPESRRRLVIAGGAAEWFGKERIEAEVALADIDRDEFISPKDFENWFHSAIKRCPDASKVAAATSVGGAKLDGDAAAVADGSTASSKSKLAVAAVPLSALVLIAIEAGLPFVGFGFLDNAVMLIAGDAIDHTVGAALSLSVMASAAMGNVCSGMLGMQVHGAVEKLVHRLSLPVPTLSDEQRSSQRVFMAGHIGGTIGIAIGLTLGMLPLLFISADDDDKVIEQAFNSIDTSHDGLVSPKELKAALERIGITIDAEHAASLVDKYSDHKGALTVADFKKLSAELRKEKKH